MRRLFKQGKERAAHRARVAEFCRRVAQCLQVSGDTEAALVEAALFHSDGPGSTPAPATISQTAESILLRRRDAPNLSRVIEIFEACDAFDESAEFSLYEGASIATAIHEFLEEGTSDIEPAVLEALRDLSTPLYRPSLANGIPIFPRAAARLMQTSAENTSAFELESIVCSDPVFAALLLGAANSVFFGGHCTISHIGQAILRIGVPFARKLLLSACVGKLFSSGALAQLWRHSKTVACLAHEFAAQCHYDQEVAYAAGLLHDIGRIATRRASPAVRAGESAWIAAGFPLVYAETLTYGCDHAALGADLLAQWNLPLEIVEAVRLHHRPESARTRLAGILYMAEEEAAERLANPESLSAGVRGAWASQIAGIAALPEGGMNRESAIFVLAG